MGEIDWATLHEESTTVLTGDHTIVIVKAEGKKSQAGKPQFKLSLAIESGPYAGRKIPTTLTLSAESPVALKIFFQTMTILGLDKAYFAQKPTMEQIAADLHGRRAVVTLEEREWQGRTSESVKTWKPADGGFGGSGGGLGLEAVSLDDLPASQPVDVATATATATEMPEDPFGD